LEKSLGKQPEPAVAAIPPPWPKVDDTAINKGERTEKPPSHAWRRRRQGGYRRPIHPHRCLRRSQRKLH
jgi:hypothetical protein